jgi:hypothetical protein
MRQDTISTLPHPLQFAKMPRATAFPMLPLQVGILVCIRNPIRDWTGGCATLKK